MSSQSKQLRVSHKKSRLGCASCKKLRIKCDEGKPSCEYCVATNRLCEYLPVPKGKPRGRSKRPVQIAESGGKSDNSNVVISSGSSIIPNESSVNPFTASNNHPVHSTTPPIPVPTNTFSPPLGKFVESQLLHNLNDQTKNRLTLNDNYPQSMIDSFLMSNSPGKVLEKRSGTLSDSFDKLSVDESGFRSDLGSSLGSIASKSTLGTSIESDLSDVEFKLEALSYDTPKSPSYSPTPNLTTYPNTPQSHFQDLTVSSISTWDSDHDLRIVDIESDDGDSDPFSPSHTSVSYATTIAKTESLYSNSSINWFSRLSAGQADHLDFFIKYGAPMCAMGVPSITRMWRTYSVQVALQSDIVLNSISAIAVYLYDISSTKKVERVSVEREIESRQYFHKAICEFRDALARDRSTHNPLELILSSCLVGAFALVDCDLVPVISRSGGLDLFGIIQGNNALFSTYNDLVRNSFARDLIMFDAGEQVDLQITVAFDNLKFLGYLTSTIEELSEKYKITEAESEVYDHTLGVIAGSCTNAINTKSLYPIITMLYECPRPFSQLCRKGRPLALIILCFMAALFRTTALRARIVFDCWDKCLQSTLREIPHEFKPYIHDAVKMRKGLKFADDTDRLHNLAFWVPASDRISSSDSV